MNEVLHVQILILSFVIGWGIGGWIFFIGWPMLTHWFRMRKYR